jgi:hypothetical protein
MPNLRHWSPPCADPCRRRCIRRLRRFGWQPQPESAAHADCDAHGPDVYRTGFVMNSAGATRPCYWKNGARTDLSVLDSSRNGQGAAIVVVSP